MISSLSLLVSAALLSAAASMYCPRAVHLALGSYTGQPWLPSASGVGITLAVLRPPLLATTARLLPELVGTNPSYLAPAGAHLYAANENGPNGTLTQVTFLSRPPHLYRASRTSGGGGTTHVAVLRARARGVLRVIMVANFGGSVTTFVRRPHALVVGDTYTVPVENAPRAGEADAFPQEAPHPHMILPYGRGALVPDLGSNTVWYFAVNPATGKIRLTDSVRLRVGDGPRHAALHGHGRSGAIYVVNELSLTLVVLRPGRCGRGLKSVCQRVSLVGNRKMFEGATAAAVRVSADGRFVYASVRKTGEDDGVIVAFRLNKRTGRVLGKVGEFSAGGVHPRDFFIIERVRMGKMCKSYIAVVNRDSNNLVLFDRDMGSGAMGAKAALTMDVQTPTSVVTYA